MLLRRLFDSRIPHRSVSGPTSGEQEPDFCGTVEQFPGQYYDCDIYFDGVCGDLSCLFIGDIGVHRRRSEQLLWLRVL